METVHPDAAWTGVTSGWPSTVCMLYAKSCLLLSPKTSSTEREEGSHLRGNSTSIDQSKYCRSPSGGGGGLGDGGGGGGGCGGGGGGVGGGGGGGGDGGGGGGGGPPKVQPVRGPQSAQSVHGVQTPYSEPLPPSSQSPSEA